MKVYQRGYFETVVKPRTPTSRTPTSSEAASPSNTSPVGLSRRNSWRSSAIETTKSSTPTGTLRRTNSGLGANSGSTSTSVSPTRQPRGSQRASTDSPDASGLPRERYRLLCTTGDQEEKKYADLYARWEKNEALRGHSEKKARERNAKAAQHRDERFQRLLYNITANDSLASDLATHLKEQEAMKRRMSRKLHAEWEEQVFGPLMAQANAQMNPDYRPSAKQLRHHQIKGRHLDFSIAEEQDNRLFMRGEDPMKREIVDVAREKAFTHVATHVVHGSPSRSSSMPDLLSASPFGSLSSGASSPAMGRQSLNPTEYSKATEHVPPPGYPRGRLRGASVHCPDESDGVLAAGTRHTRADGHHNKGILHGDRARGQANEHKMHHGAGSSAPMQDHYNFACGREITDLEIPLGKRVFPDQVK